MNATVQAMRAIPELQTALSAVNPVADISTILPPNFLSDALSGQASTTQGQSQIARAIDQASK